MSHQCHDEHTQHQDGHHDDHGDHDHNHDHSDDVTPALQTYLYRQVEFDKIETLNERTPGSGVAIVKKGWDKRMDPEPELESDADEQLLMYIPFTGQVKLHSILLRTSATASAPSTLKLFLNRDDLDFATATDLPPTQTLALSQTSQLQDIPLKRARWNTTRSITLFVEYNHGLAPDDDGHFTTTRIAFLGFTGDWMPLSREPVSFLYEAAANPADHPAVVGTKTGAGQSGAAGEGL